MKRQKLLIATLIGIIIFIFLGIIFTPQIAFYSIMYLQYRLNLSNFKIKGTIVDTEGILLNDVEMRIVLNRPKFPYFTSSERISKKMKVNSEFSVSESGFSNIELTFFKKGYYLESRSFSKHTLQQMEEGQSNSIIQKDIQIKMTKEGIRAERISFHENLQYNIKDEHSHPVTF